MRGTHEITYEAFIGPIPDGHELDHVECQQTMCCNPWHVEPVTHQINMSRAVYTPEERTRRSAWMYELHRRQKECM